MPTTIDGEDPLSVAPPCPEYPHHPEALLRAVADEIARHMNVSIEDLRVPENLGDRTACFLGRKANGSAIFVKMIGTSNADTRNLFKHEIEVTSALNSTVQSGFSVPRLLGNCQHLGIDWMAVEHIEGSRVLLTEETFDPLVRALRALRELPADLIVGHTGCGSDHMPRGAVWYKGHFLETSARLLEQGYITLEQREIIIRFSDRVLPELHEEGRRPSASHGDFAPNNVRFRDGTIVVLDWEHSHLNHGPIDLAHYSTTSHVWDSALREKFIRAIIDDWEFDEKVFLLTQLERLTGRANDTFCRRGKRDEATLKRLDEMTTSLQRFLP